MNQLRIADALRLPVEAVTQTFVIFGKRGSGKSNTAVVMAEEMFPFAPFVVLDPIGAWWGLKSSFDGKGPGLPVYIFGGEHGDLPLGHENGQLLADVFIEHRLPMVLDLKGFSGAQRARFVTEFALRLLARNARVPVHVFLEEADAFVPQRPMPGEQAMLGAMDRLVRWGRQEGIGATLITQRSAKVNKDVTTQAETLIAHRTIGPQDRDAIDAWIKFHAGGEERQQVLETLATLPDGTAWIWSPEWLDILKRVAVRRRKTYDSASTPRVGEKRPEPKQLAAVDVERLRDRLAVTIERAKADDPRELRRRIADLERQLTTARKARPEVREVIREVETPPDPAPFLEAYRLMEEAGNAVSRALKALAPLTKRGGRVAARPAPSRPPARDIRTSTSHSVPESGVRPESNGNFKITPSYQKILDALAWYEVFGVSPATRTQVALVAGYSPNSGGFNNYVGALNSAGLTVGGSGTLALTAAGRAEARSPEVAPTSAALQATVKAKVGPSKARILDALIEAWPDALSRDELAHRTGYSANSGGFNNYLGSLNTLGVIGRPAPGFVRAGPVLFIEERA